MKHRTQFNFFSKTSAILVSLGVSLGLLLSGCQKAKSRPNTLSDSIEVGEVQTLTGSEAAFGTAIHRGIELAVKQINEAGGIQGRTIRLITLDDQGKSDEAATAVTKLISQHKVTAILGALASSRSLAMAPIAQKNKIPMITPTATHPQVTRTGDYIFRVCFADAFQGQVMAKFALRNLKVKKIAILQDIKSDYSLGLSHVFSKTIKEGGGKVLPIQSYSAGDIDFKAQLTVLRGQNPEAIYIPGYYTEVGLIARQARELGIKTPLLGGDGWSSPKLLEIASQAANDSYYSDHFSSEDHSEKVQRFVKSFESTYHLVPDGISALGYDSVNLLAEAIRKSNTLTPESIRESLSQLSEFPAVTGNITFDQNRDPIKSAVIMKIQNGKPTFFMAQPFQESI